jgi:hypothetical protein
MTQTIATATTTPIGTTRFRRTRSHREDFRSLVIRGSVKVTTPSFGNILFAASLAQE